MICREILADFVNILFLIKLPSSRQDTLFLPKFNFYYNSCKSNFKIHSVLPVGIHPSGSLSPIRPSVHLHLPSHLFMINMDSLTHYIQLVIIHTVLINFDSRIVLEFKMRALSSRLLSFGIWLYSFLDSVGSFTSCRTRCSVLCTFSAWFLS